MAGVGEGERGYDVRLPDPDAARELGRSCGVSAATAQVLLHRGVHEAGAARSFLEPRLSELTSPDDMVDRQRASQRLARAVRRGERIVVFGDYDVDGTTSAVLLADVLETLGASVCALVADRFEGGYGFSDAALARCRELGAGVVVTCDCGSTDHERIDRAIRAGIDVIVVDHHRVPGEPLPAEAFVNPHRPDCGFPYKGLASAGLALSLAAATRAELGQQLDVRSWLDLVALGTVADVAPLDGDNRRLVRAGLQRLSRADARPGVAALREAAKLRAGSTLGTIDIAFRLAPRLNAAGRLGESSLTLELLRARDADRARALAARVEQLNARRKELTEHASTEAAAQVEAVYGTQPHGGVVVASDGWHRGVVGIVAARLVERFGVPVACVALDGDTGHGSVRGPQGAALYDTLHRCDDALRGFGGHQEAAGLTLDRGRLEAFRAAFMDASGVGAVEAGAPALVDVELDNATFGVPNADDLWKLEPFGHPNAEPLFAVPDARVESRKVVGEHHAKLELRVGQLTMPAFGLRMAHRLDDIPATVSLIGHLRPDPYRGRAAVELHLTGRQVF